MKRLFLILILITAFIGVKAQNKSGDSLKVYVCGTFYNESFKFVYGNKVYTKKVKKGTRAFAFFIAVPDTLKPGSYLPLEIYRKGRFGLKYKSASLDCSYQGKEKYFILWRDNIRQKRKYPFIQYWENKPAYNVNVSRTYWDYEIHEERWKMDKIISLPVY